tara:strand:+ start:17643 stop:17822 length:180 start_codon:yes stop_codon:yes gene_type:complete
MNNDNLIYEVTKAHHFIQKLKVLINNARIKQHEATEAIEELEKGINEIIKQLKQEINDE